MKPLYNFSEKDTETLAQLREREMERDRLRMERDFDEDSGVAIGSDEWRGMEQRKRERLAHMAMQKPSPAIGKNLDAAIDLIEKLFRSTT